MLRMSLIVSLLLLCACGNSAQRSAEPAGDRGPGFSRPREVVPGEVLVKFKPDVPQERIAAVLAEMKVEVIRVFKDLRLYHIRITGGRSLEEAIREFSHLPEVEYAEPNYIRKGLEGNR